MSELEPTRTYSNPTANDILRRMLDERGVEWKAWDGVHPITVWHDETYLYEFVEYRLVNGAKQVSGCLSDNDGHCELTIKVFNCTPEQAIAATLGATDARPTQVESSGTCHVEWRENGWGTRTRHCGKCGADLDCDTRNRQNFCPNCGTKIVDPTTNDVDAEVEQ